MATGIVVSGRFFWNIDRHVGPNRANLAEDVQLVQLGYACMGENTKFPQPPEAKAILSKIVPGDRYSGDPNDPLSQAIRMHEKRHGGTQDGIVSPIHGSSGGYGPGIGFLMNSLNNNIFDVIGEKYPFLDAHPKCPPALKDAVTRLFRTHS